MKQRVHLKVQTVLELSSDQRSVNRLRGVVRDLYERHGVCSWVEVAPTGSMDPFFGGQIAVLVRWGRIDPRRGEIILFMTPDGILGVHRAVSVRPENGAVLQMADQFTYRDPYSGGWVPRANLLGRVIGFRTSSEPACYVDLDTPLARACGRLLAANLWLLWRLGGRQAGWFHAVEPIRRLAFNLFRRVHLATSFAVVTVISMRSKRRGRQHLRRSLADLGDSPVQEGHS